MRDPARLREALISEEPLAAANPSSVVIVHAPGRVNLIGEHTDYNSGLVMPAAINLGISIALLPTEDRRVELSIARTGERGVVDLDAIPGRAGGWIDYVAGTAWSMTEAGARVAGFRGLLASDLPSGAGLSSSAAIELAVAWALAAGEPPLDDTMRVAEAARRAENEYVGVASGLMDQFASAFGVAGAALLLDCRSLEHRAISLPLDDVALVVCDSGIKRRLVGSEYDDRRAQCERAAREIAAIDPSVRTLRDVTLPMLEAAAPRLDPLALRRARHVVTENARVLQVEDAFRRGDLEAVGAAFAASHASLRDDFEVSIEELDVLVEIAANTPGVIGSRLTGAGFGGSTITLVRHDAVEALGKRVRREYPARTGREPTVREVRPAAGARRIDPRPER